MLLLPRGELRDAANVGAKLRKAIAVHPFFDPSEPPPNKVTVSIGAATVIASDDGQGESLLARATQALLAAQQAGKNRVHGGEQPILAPADGITRVACAAAPSPRRAVAPSRSRSRVEALRSRVRSLSPRAHAMAGARARGA